MTTLPFALRCHLFFSWPSSVANSVPKLHQVLLRTQGDTKMEVRSCRKKGGEERKRKMFCKESLELSLVVCNLFNILLFLLPPPPPPPSQQAPAPCEAPLTTQTMTAWGVCSQQCRCWMTKRLVLCLSPILHELLSTLSSFS